MKKFLYRFLLLPDELRSKFLAGLLAGFWGKCSRNDQKLVAVINSWLARIGDIDSGEERLMEEFELICASSELNTIPKGSLNNIFSRFNKLLDTALPFLANIESFGNRDNHLRIAVEWLKLGNSRLVNEILAKNHPKVLYTTEELEDWLYFHLEVYNHIIHKGKANLKNDSLSYHFEQIRKIERSLAQLREIRLLCSASNSVDAAKKIFEKYPGITKENIPATETIVAFQACYQMICGQDSNLTKQLWIQTNGFVFSRHFPQNSSEFRELTRYLLNIGMVMINSGLDTKFWNTECFELLDVSFQQDVLVENGSLPAQHLVNYCRIASVIGKVDFARNQLDFLRGKLSLEDQTNGEPAFCESFFHYSNKKYEEAWNALSLFHPTEKRKLAYFTLRLKIAMEANRDELLSTIESFTKWINEGRHKKHSIRISNEIARLKLAKRIATLRSSSKKRKDNLWEDISKSAIDREWLQEMFVLRLGLPSEGN